MRWMDDNALLIRAEQMERDERQAKFYVAALFVVFAIIGALAALGTRG